jgi:hypothetical protein
MEARWLMATLTIPIDEDLEFFLEEQARDR